MRVRLPNLLKVLPFGRLRRPIPTFQWGIYASVSLRRRLQLLPANDVQSVFVQRFAKCEAYSVTTLPYVPRCYRWPVRACAGPPSHPYSYRSAAIGSSRAAFKAGHNPKNSPTLTATLKPATTDHIGTVEGRLSTRVRIARLSSQPKRMPIAPPDAVSVIASSRNCQMISLRRAPIALRTPISRVRSVTET